MGGEAMNWAAKQRQVFIGNFIKEYGEINRSDLMQEFRIGGASATRDLQQFINDNPNVLIYNVTKKRYEVNPQTAGEET